ncbi:MAG: DUF2285 domain-containing protein [Sphingomonadales bacterium]|nr:MAG: DUF2285 domain-containing protein [Sphingomonadales bacterium]
MIIEAKDPGQAFPLPNGSEPLVDIATGKERHIVAAHGTARLRLCVRHAPSRPVPTYAIPCDAACVLRLAAASRLQRVTRGDRITTDRAALPSPNQRVRYTGLLRVHDALETGASSRDIAFGLVFPNHHPLAGAIWKGSGERRQALRLIAYARRLIATGYRRLLLHR